MERPLGGHSAAAVTTMQEPEMLRRTPRAVPLSMGLSAPRWPWRLSVLLACCLVSPVAAGVSLGPLAEWRGGAEDVELFQRLGFVWIRGFLTLAEVARLRDAMDRLLDEWERSGATASLSSLRAAKEDDNHGFFLESATKASVFLESGTDPDAALTRRSVRKVAHGLHLQPGPFQDFVRSPALARVVSDLGWREPVAVQTLYRLVPPLAAGVDRHQDSTTLYTEPPSVLGLWLPLEDADEANGCLQIRVGSHREPVRERLVRRPRCDEGGHCRERLVFERLLNFTHAPLSDFVPLKMQAGDLLVMDGRLEHLSAAGTDPNRSRESLQVHVVEASARWMPDNWLQYPEGMSFMPLHRLDPPLASASPQPESPSFRADL